MLAAFGALRAFRLSAKREAEFIEDDPAPNLGTALQQIAKSKGPRSALLLLAAQGLLLGCLDLLVVVIANHLHGGLANAGWYGTALGAGAMIGGTASAVLIGRRVLWPAAVAATVAAACTVAALCAVAVPLAAAAVFVAIGATSAIMLVAGRASLQRLTELRLLSHVFAAAEATESATLLAGALLVPLMVPLMVTVAGVNGSCLAIAGILLTIAVIITQPLATAERGALGAFERVAALRRAEALTHLGAAMLESLARAAEPHIFPPGDALMTQGDPGEDYHVIVSGDAVVTQDGVIVNRVGAGVGVGELALLFNTPRTATVTAIDEVRTLSLSRETFLLALTQQPPPTSFDAVLQSRMGRR